MILRVVGVLAVILISVASPESRSATYGKDVTGLSVAGIAKREGSRSGCVLRHISVGGIDDGKK